MDERDRDKFYTAPDKDSDDDEYELEPPDPVADENRRRAARDSVDPTIDIDDIYRDADRNRGAEILENWVRNFRFQFQVKHLLILTAVLAIILTLARLQILGTALVILIMLSVFGLYMYLQWEEKKQQDEAARKREEVYARRRAQLEARSTGHVVGTPAVPVATAPPPVPELPNEVDETWLAAREKEAFRFQFSLRELLMTMTIAAVTLGMIRVLGGAEVMATLLGLFALVGLILFATGYQPPQIVILGWWLIILLYVAASLFVFVWGGPV
jgi:hypothetical protein